MNILDNELVRKYFEKCQGHNNHAICRVWDCTIHKRILDSMQQLIRKGERYLAIEYECVTNKPLRVKETISTCDSNIMFRFLRLPDAFQKQEPRIKKCGCGEFQFYDTIHRVDGPCYQIDKPPSPEPGAGYDYVKPKDAVDKEIEQIVKRMPEWSGCEMVLRDLVRLARETK